MRLVFCVFMIVVLPGFVGAQGPSVVLIGPAANSLGNQAAGEIVVDFDVPVSVLSVNADNFHVFGRWSGPMNGSFSNENGQTRFRFSPSGSFFAGEMVIVTIDKEVHSLSPNIPMDDGYSFSFWIGSIPTGMELYINDTIPVRQKGEGHIQSYGAYAGDLNDDDYSDLTVVNEASNDVRVFLNDQTGDFNYLDTYGSPAFDKPSPIEGADFNQDGFIDLAVVSTNNNQVSIFYGDGTGVLTYDSSYTADTGIRGLGVLDLNGDGWDDIVTTNRIADNATILLNLGNGTFGPSEAFHAGVEEWALCVGDANEDGLMDVFIGAATSNELFVFLSNGSGALIPSDVVAVAGKHWMLMSGDVDLDGHVDVVGVDADNDLASVYFGDGAGHLTFGASYPCGAWPVAVDLGDLDGDGDLDLATSNYNSADYTVYENDGTGVYINPATYAALQAGSCAIFHDRDGDGDVDLTGIDELDDVILIFDDDSIWTTISVPELTDLFTDVSVYPNPASGPVTVSFDLEAAVNLRVIIVNALGQEVAQISDETYTAGQHKLHWDASQFEALGTYFLRMETENGALSIPCVVGHGN